MVTLMRLVTPTAMIAVARQLFSGPEKSLQNAGIPMKIASPNLMDLILPRLSGKPTLPQTC